MKVETRSPYALQTRKAMVELQLARCPSVPVSQRMAEELGIEEPRFPSEHPEEDCILCGLCVRACEEIAGKKLLGSTGRGAERRLTTPFDLAYDGCVGCNICIPYCPAGAISNEGVINLKGSVVQSGGRGVAFTDSLGNDLKSKVYSFVLIDQDNDDYVRVVRKAAQDDLLCGWFFISEPDFEFANFTLSELEEIIWAIAIENGVSPSDRRTLHNALANVQSGDQLEKTAKHTLPALNQFSKGISWGERLMSFAWENPEIVDDATGEMKTRPIIDALKAAVQAVGADYHASRTRLRVDPVSRRPVKRNDQ